MPGWERVQDEARLRSLLFGELCFGLVGIFGIEWVELVGPGIMSGRETRGVDFIKARWSLGAPVDFKLVWVK